MLMTQIQALLVRKALREQLVRQVQWAQQVLREQMGLLARLVHQDLPVLQALLALRVSQYVNDSKNLWD